MYGNDTLEGHSNVWTSYEFAPGQDTIIEDGDEIPADAWNYPVPDMIACG